MERGTRVSQAALNRRGDRVRATEHAPRGPFYLLERRHGLAEIIERRARVLEECQLKFESKERLNCVY